MMMTEVNANKHLLVLNTLWIKYSMYDIKCDVNYCVYCILCDMGKINVNDKILIENLRKQKTWGSKKLLEEFASKGLSRSGLDSLLRRIELEHLCYCPSRRLSHPSIRY